MASFRRGLIASCLLVSLVVPAMPIAEAAFSGENGRIVFRQASAISSMDGDGSNVQVIPHTDRADEPAWAPDGNQIAFTYEADIWIVTEWGDGLRNLTNSPGVPDMQAAWSPDGSEIAFTSTRSNNADVYVVRSSDGGGERRLTDSTAFEGYPEWSPDGELIAFTTNRSSPGYGIYTMPSDDGDPESRIASTSVINVFHSWFPDGSKLAYDHANDVWVTEADGSSQTKLTTNARAFFGLAVSPDGTKIAFTDGRTGDNEIYVIDADGSNEVNITNNPGVDDRYPDWGVVGTGVTRGTDEDDDLDGTTESDTVFAGGGDDTVATLGGNDTVFGEGGNDHINGGAGNDRLYGDSAPAPKSKPSAHRSQLRAAQEEEEPAAAGNDVLLGGGGVDLAVGGDGDDTLNGGPGVDRLKGGPGEDTCVFSSRKELSRSSSCEHKKRNFKRNFAPALVPAERRDVRRSG